MGRDHLLHGLEAMGRNLDFILIEGKGSVDFNDKCDVISGL